MDKTNEDLNFNLSSKEIFLTDYEFKLIYYFRKLSDMKKGEVFAFAREESAKADMERMFQPCKIIEISRK